MACFPAGEEIAMISTETKDTAAVTSSSTCSVTILLPVIDETFSLRDTVRILLDENRPAIAEILCVVCRKTTAEARAVCDHLAVENPGLIHVREQKRPFLGGAMQDAFEWATGSHVLMMASDLETDPHLVRDMIAESTKGWDVVATARWTAGGGFEGYNPVKYVLNWTFQKIIGVLYGVPFSDLTYGFRLYRTTVLRGVKWEETRHPFLLESILTPLRLGATVTEIPARWQARREGQSHNTFWQNFAYLRTAVRVRVAPVGSLRGNNG
jgi:hypothetical protein